MSWIVAAMRSFSAAAVTAALFLAPVYLSRPQSCISNSKTQA